MYTLAMLIALLCWPVGIFGLINVVKPLGRLRITTRRRGAAVLGLSILMFLVFAAIGAANTPPDVQARFDAEAQADAEKAATAPSGVTQAEFDTYYDGVQNALRPCDQAVSDAVRSVRTGDIYTAYLTTKRAEDTCLSTGTDVRAVKIPRSAKSEIKKAFQNARDACEFVGTAKWSAMRQAAKVLDGDARPSAVTSAQEGMAALDSVTLRCAASILDVSVKAGLQLPGDGRTD